MYLSPILGRLILVILLTSDLFFAGAVRGAVESAGLAFKHFKAWNTASEGAAETVSACIVDLSSIKLAELTELASELRNDLSGAELVAFGPHVHANRLAAASEAGFDRVLSRGQFSSQIGELAQRWAQA